MRTLTKKLTFILSAILVAQALLFSNETKIVDIKFQMVCVEKSIDMLKYKNNGKAVDLSIPNASFSYEYRYKGPTGLTFYAEKKAPDGTTVDVPVYTLEIPEEANGMNLLFIVSINKKNTKEPLKFTVFSKEKNLSDPNTMIVINQTDEPLRVFAGITDIKLKSGAMNKATVQTSENGRFPLAIYKLANGESTKTFQTYLKFRERQSLFLFISPDHNDPRRLKVHQIAYNDRDHKKEQSTPEQAQVNARKTGAPATQ
jgi:hypothetical protein